MSRLFASVAVVISIWMISVSQQRYSAEGQPEPHIISELKPLLSPDASIVLPNSLRFTKDSRRWQSFAHPTYEAIVEVSTEADIEHTIQFANKHSKPFLAISGAHGLYTGLEKVQNGIGISMRGMNSVEIAEDGKTATVAGGVRNGDLLAALWAKGKQSVTTECLCTGAVAPMLGGGHGFLEGTHGLMLDNVVSMRMVLANGTSITVSNSERPDLWWAVRGAGANFGIVSKFVYQIYDVTPSNKMWAYENMFFTFNKTPSMFEKANALISGPAKIFQFGTTFIMPAIDPKHPVTQLSILSHEGSVPEEYIKPFIELGPVHHSNHTSELIHLSDNFGLNGCQYLNHSIQVFPVGLSKWSPTGWAKALEIFSQLPQEFNRSYIVWEGHTLAEANIVPAASTAYAFRERNMLIGLAIVNDNEPKLNSRGAEWGSRMRQAWVDASGQPLSAYINYAHGDESQEALYGYEPWRLQRLRKLKREYDPLNRFSFYAPIKT